MSNIHVLDEENGRIRIAFHFAIPNTNNPRGVNYRTALIQLGQYGTTALPDGAGTNGTISALEKADITARAVIEVVREIKRAQMTNAYLDSLHATLLAETQADIQARLANYGHIR